MSKTYLITGASSDVGACFIEYILPQLSAGDEIIAQGAGDLQNLEALQNANTDKIFTYDVDLSSCDAIDAFIAEISAKHAVPTHIIHLPALRAINTKFKNFDEARFALDMNVQITSALKLCKAFLPKMAKAKNGRVLFMQTSYTLGAPPKNMAAYVMAKDAMAGLAKSLAVEYASFGITVNSVAPSMMETKFLAETPRLIVEASAEANPMKRNATAADVVPAMAFLCSEEARFITGVTLPITGGSTIV